MSEPQDKQNLPSDVAGDSPPAVETTAADNADNDDGGRDLSKQNPLNQAAKGSTPGVPRAIRARTGQTEDPVPEGKHIAEHKCVRSSACCLVTLLSPYKMCMLCCKCCLGAMPELPCAFHEHMHST